jgi:adenylate cyclase
MRDPETNDADGVAPRNEAKPLRFAGLVLDLDACALQRESGDAIPLTRGEFALLRVFATRPGRVLSRDTVLNALGDRRFEPFDRSVDMQVQRLRRKIEPDPKRPRLIVTVPGEGYRFDGLARTFRSDDKLTITTPALVNDGRRTEQDHGSSAPTAHDPGSLPPSEEPSSRQAKASEETRPPEPQRRLRFALLAAGAIVLLVVVVGGARHYLTANLAATVASDTARPSLVVLPFVNISGDPAQDYLVDALTGELTTSIARWTGSVVIARSTAFTFKGKPVDAKAIGKELGVRYVVEGSVQSSGAQVRVSTQLTDAESGAQVWVDRFDTTRADLLQTQDEIVVRLAWAVGVRFVEAEAARLKRKPAANPDAQDLALQCAAIRLKSRGPFGTKDEPGFPLCEQALAIDPNNTLALVTLSVKYWSPAANGRSADPEGDLKRGDELVSKALSVDPNFAYALHWKAIILAFQGRTDEAIAEDELSLSLDPSIVEANVTLGNLYLRLGQFEKGMELIEKALRLSPRDPSASYWHKDKAIALFALGRYDESVEGARRSIITNPTLPAANSALAAALALTGRVAEAHEAVERLAAFPPGGLKTNAAWNAYSARITHERANPRYLEYWDRRIEGMRQAGLPEE